MHILPIGMRWSMSGGLGLYNRIALLFITFCIDQKVTKKSSAELALLKSKTTRKRNEHSIPYGHSGISFGMATLTYFY